MSLSRVAHENPTPTHDAQRDIEAPVKAHAHYDLTSGSRSAPVRESSMSLRGTSYGVAEEEETGMIDATGGRVMARSGNGHWDGDDYALAGDSRVETRAGEDPGMPIATGLVIAAAAIGLWLLLRKD